ncbi:MAG: tRNA (cytosine(32)/uridine(32)-2'-O)-methyltransferase TrmJ [Gammaproteobacteria bacterium]|nr:MAG: tRNA (cytosine(32)/uridine(32)-2'-O)-methyltransferase TrmJ [Gammaproteobacteria bacterium]
MLGIMLSNIRIVLVNTSHPGNIGGTARAMMNMGLETLYLVEPKKFPAADATARASGASGVLAKAVVCDDLDLALKGCSYVFGASARLRRVSWPQVMPRECARIALEASDKAPVALVFGRERTGLTNDELERCNYLVNIPSVADFPALNIVTAVQILVYEIRMLMVQENDSMAIVQGNNDDEPATADELERMYKHFREALIDIEFLDPDNPKQLMRRLKRLFNRTHLDKMEVNILRGILTSAQKARKP